MPELFTFMILLYQNALDRVGTVAYLGLFSSWGCIPCSKLNCSVDELYEDSKEVETKEAPTMF